jgi:hypothetical protein
LKEFAKVPTGIAANSFNRLGDFVMLSAKSSFARRRNAKGS